MSINNLINNVGFLKKFNRYLLVGFSALLLLYLGQGASLDNFRVEKAYAGLYCNGVWHEELPDVPGACDRLGSSSNVSSGTAAAPVQQQPAQCTRTCGGSGQRACSGGSDSRQNGCFSDDSRCVDGLFDTNGTCRPPQAQQPSAGGGGASAGGNLNVNCADGQTVQGPNGTIVVCSTSQANAAANASIGNVTAGGGSATATNTAQGGAGGGGGTATASNTATGGAGGPSTNTNTSTGGSSSVSGSGNSGQGGTVTVLLAQANPTPTPTPVATIAVAQPSVVSVAGTSAAKLPATGLPEMALGLMSFIPLGWKFKKFSKGPDSKLNGPHLIWQQRQFNR